MKIEFTLDENELKELIRNHVNEKIGHELPLSSMSFLVKSKNNYKPQEWEPGLFKMSVIADI